MIKLGIYTGLLATLADVSYVAGWQLEKTEIVP